MAKEAPSPRRELAALRGVAWFVVAMAGLSAYGSEKFGFLSKAALALAVVGLVVLEVSALLKRNKE